MAPGGSQGLESLFRTFEIRLADNKDIPDLNQPVEHLIEAINKLGENNKSE
jgi:hypothetical protein